MIRDYRPKKGQNFGGLDLSVPLKGATFWKLDLTALFPLLVIPFFCIYFVIIGPKAAAQVKESK
jgi:hypothetical protein